MWLCRGTEQSVGCLEGKGAGTEWARGLVGKVSGEGISLSDRSIKAKWRLLDTRGPPWVGHPWQSRFGERHREPSWPDSNSPGNGEEGSI